MLRWFCSFLNNERTSLKVGGQSILKEGPGPHSAKKKVKQVADFRKEAVKIFRVKVPCFPKKDFKRLFGYRIRAVL